MERQVKKMDEDLKLVCKVYEKELFDLLPTDEFRNVQHKCFRMLQIAGIEKAEPGDWKDFLTGIVKPTEKELEEYKEIKKGWC